MYHYEHDQQLTNEVQHSRGYGVLPVFEYLRIRGIYMKTDCQYLAILTLEDESTCETSEIQPSAINNRAPTKKRKGFYEFFHLTIDLFNIYKMSITK